MDSKHYTEVLIDGKYEEKIDDLVPLIMEELNVKEVVFEKDLSQFMDFSLKPNFKIAGPVLGGKIKAFGKALNELEPHETVEKLELGEKLILNLDGEDVEITKDFVMVNISSKKGFDVAMENNLFVILDTTLTKELEKEGFVETVPGKGSYVAGQNKELLKEMSTADLSMEVEATLKELRARGVRLAIGSSSKNARFILNQIGLGDFFDAISDGNNITKSKPDPEVFVKAAEFLGIPAEKCLVVEDAGAGVQAAEAGGMDCAAVGDAAERHIATYDMKSFMDLLQIVKKEDNY